MGSIKISQKHGLNPSIPICFWCGKDKNEIALLGKLKNDEEAPEEVLLDYEPCDECKEKMEKGVLCIEVLKENPNNLPPISKDPNNQEVYPTGRFFVITEECANRIFENSNFKKGGRCCIESDLFNLIFEQIEKK